MRRKPQRSTSGDPPANRPRPARPVAGRCPTASGSSATTVCLTNGDSSAKWILDGGCGSACQDARRRSRPVGQREARRKLGEANARRRREEIEWDRTHDRPDPEVFTREILPLLEGVSLSKMRAATGLSVTMCAKGVEGTCRTRGIGRAFVRSRLSRVAGVSQPVCIKSASSRSNSSRATGVLLK